jgi:hypothetical protein
MHGLHPLRTSDVPSHYGALLCLNFIVMPCCSVERFASEFPMSQEGYPCIYVILWNNVETTRSRLQLRAKCPRFCWRRCCGRTPPYHAYQAFPHQSLLTFHRFYVTSACLGCSKPPRLLSSCLDPTRFCFVFTTISADHSHRCCFGRSLLDC